MTRQLVDVLRSFQRASDMTLDDDGLVASLLADGPAEHPCPTCNGSGELRSDHWYRCEDCVGEGVVQIGVLP